MNWAITSKLDKNVDFPLLNGAGDTLERGDGEEREEDGDKCGNKFCPGENNDDGDTFSLKKNLKIKLIFGHQIFHCFYHSVCNYEYIVFPVNIKLN